MGEAGVKKEGREERGGVESVYIGSFQQQQRGNKLSQRDREDCKTFLGREKAVLMSL